MDLSFITNLKLQAYIKRNLDQPTVILCFLILLENDFDNPGSTKLTKTEVGKRFNKQNKDFGINTYRRDYLKRQSGDAKNAINEDETSQCFFLRPEFLKGMGKPILLKISKDIREHYKLKGGAIDDFIIQISDLIKKKDITNSIKLIKEMLADEGTGKRGQNFEIGSYSVLKTFFQSYGFTLNRFSTTFANDGGMDFVGQNAIYQVATVMNTAKFNEDIIKSPGIPRVIVYKRIAPEFDVDKFIDKLILRTISADELNGLIKQLSDSKGKNYILEIMETIKHEYQRENYKS